MKLFNSIFVLILLSGVLSTNVQTEQLDQLRNDVNFLLWNRHRNNYLYKDAIIHQDIYAALSRGIIEKVGTPAGWNDNYPVWNKRNILNIGVGVQGNGQGLKINVPEGFDVLWVRVLNDRWTTFRITGDTQSGQDQGEPEKYACGHRNLNEYSPDGAAPDSFHTVHMWCQMPVRFNAMNGTMLYSGINSDSWISGIAFGKNLWGHVRNSAVAYHWQLNGGDALRWHTHNWNNDQLASLDAGAFRTMRVPVVPNGKDKMLYFVEHNNNWIGVMHGEVWVGENKVGRFRTTYQNAFATHYNSKQYCRYIAVLVRKEIIDANAKFLDLRVDMSMSDHHIHIREAGTHDA
jgi:hypothetical protein